MTAENERPEPGELADEQDTQAWDRARHGRMRDHAEPDDAVPVERATNDWPAGSVVR